MYKYEKYIAIKLRYPKIITHNNELLLFGSQLNKKEGEICQYLSYMYKLDNEFNVLLDTKKQITISDNLYESTFIRNIQYIDNEIELLIEFKTNHDDKYYTHKYKHYHLMNNKIIITNIDANLETKFYFGNLNNIMICNKIECDPDHPQYFWGKYLFEFIENENTYKPQFDRFIDYNTDKGHVVHNIIKNKNYFKIIFSIRTHVGNNEYRYDIYESLTKDAHTFYNTRKIELLDDSNVWHSYPHVFEYDNEEYLVCNGDDFGKVKGLFIFKKSDIIIFNKHDVNGTLVPINNSEIPFDIKRLFYIYNTPYNVTRGNHGNRYTDEIMICLNGSVEVTLDTHVNKKTYQINNKNEGLYIKANTWITFKCSGDAILLILCNTEFSPDDRIDDYNEIISHHQQK